MMSGVEKRRGTKQGASLAGAAHIGGWFEQINGF